MAAADDFLRMLSAAQRGGQDAVQWGGIHGPAGQFNKLLARLNRLKPNVPTLPVGHRPAVPDVLWTNDQWLRNALNHKANVRQWSGGDIARFRPH